MTNDTPIDELISSLDDLPPDSRTLRLRTDTRRYGKTVTIIDGLDPRSTDMRALTKRLKQRIAAGGSHQDGRVVLQGEHMATVRDELERMGYSVSVTTT